MYLDYEGPVSGNRGHVIRWDNGTFAWQQIQANRLIVELNGERLRGSLILEQTSGDQWKVSYTHEG
jgi:hypothetical protein